MPRILLNGEPVEIAPATTVETLLADRGLGTGRVAVEVDGEVVPRGEHGGRCLADGARVEIVRALGGG